MQTWIEVLSPEVNVDWLVGACCRLYKYEKHSAVSSLKICLSGLELQPGWVNTKT